MKTSDAGDEWFYTHKEKLKSIEKEFKAYFLTAFEINKSEFEKVLPSTKVEAFITKPVKPSPFVEIINGLMQHRS